MSTTTIGFVGLGAMGLPMAQNLVRRGFAVRGFNVRADAMARLTRAGGTAAATAAEAACGAEFLLLMVVNAAQAEEVLFVGGALGSLPDEATVVLMATCSPREVEGLAARTVAAGRRFLDAPVSGGVAGATNATLTIMAAGPHQSFDAARPVLEALGDKVFHVGEDPGQGSMVKTVNQLLCGVHLAVAAEAFALAAKVGVDLETMRNVLSSSAASSWMLKDRGERMLQPNPLVTSTIDIFVKDLGIVLTAGADAKTALPFAALAHQMFLAVSGQGQGADDDSQIIQAYRRLNGRR